MYKVNTYFAIKFNICQVSQFFLENIYQIKFYNTFLYASYSWEFS